MIFPHGLKSFFGYSTALTYLLTSTMRLKVSVYVKYHGYSNLQCAQCSWQVCRWSASSRNFQNKKLTNRALQDNIQLSCPMQKNLCTQSSLFPCSSQLQKFVWVKLERSLWLLVTALNLISIYKAYEAIAAVYKVRLDTYLMTYFLEIFHTPSSLFYFLSA